MSRFKTFDATGIAPNGKLFAGDLNAIQDMKADQANFSQTIDVGTLRVGDGTLQLVKYATGEVRFAGAAVRADGIVRGLGGLYAGAFTTTQRDAIPTGFRPTGLFILNTTVGRVQINNGTDASPVWQSIGAGITDADVVGPISVSKLGPGSNGQFLGTVGGVATWTGVPQGVPTGAVLPWPGLEGAIPGGYALCDGRDYGQTDPTYAGLYAKIGTAWNTFGGLAAPAAGRFRVPDLRGCYMVGRNTMGGGTPPALTAGKIQRAAANTLANLIGEELHSLSLAEGANHNHGGVTGLPSAFHSHTFTTGNNSVTHIHSGTTAGRNAAHTHGGTTAGPNQNVVGNPGSPWQIVSGAGGFGFDSHTHNFGTGTESSDHAHTFSTGANNVSHTHSGTTDAEASPGHSHTIAASGSGSAHENCPPSAVVNYIIAL